MIRRTRRSVQRPRVHLLAHANPIAKDVDRFAFPSLDAYLEFIRGHLPREFDLTFALPILKAVETPDLGGRTDDAARIRDIQGAIDDPATCAIVALSGGGYFSRILPHLRLGALARRRRPVLVTGFSEMTNFLNLVAGYRSGRAWYWLCPNYLAWKVSPPTAARAAFGAFWAMIGAGLAEGAPLPRACPGVLDFPESITLDVAAGRVSPGQVRIFGGCLSVLAVLAAWKTRLAVVRPGSWLLIEDVNEAPHRIDRQIAALKFAGWLDRLGGVIVGDFHTGDADQKSQTVELLRYHLRRSVPILTAPHVGHVWPMAAVPLNRPLRLSATRGRVTIG